MGSTEGQMLQGFYRLDLGEIILKFPSKGLSVRFGIRCCKPEYPGNDKYLSKGRSTYDQNTITRGRLNTDILNVNKEVAANNRAEGSAEYALDCTGKRVIF
jgi:hypothetical protein